MKLIAHRGWAAGGDENTLAAFARAAGDARISGVEFDVRRAASGILVVSHDPPGVGASPLTFDELLLFLSRTNLELFVELKETGLASAVIEKLVSTDMADRSTVFAFADVAKSLPWHGVRPVRLGVIVMYPWNLNRVARAWRPDVLLLGWDRPVWTRVAFRAWWSVFSLERLARRHRVPIVVGIAQRMADLHWLSRQHIHAAVSDISLTVAAADEQQHRMYI